MRVGVLRVPALAHSVVAVLADSVTQVLEELPVTFVLSLLELALQLLLLPTAHRLSGRYWHAKSVVVFSAGMMLPRAAYMQVRAGRLGGFIAGFLIPFANRGVTTAQRRFIVAGILVTLLVAPFVWLIGFRAFLQQRAAGLAILPFAWIALAVGLGLLVYGLVAKSNARAVNEADI